MLFKNFHISHEFSIECTLDLWSYAQSFNLWHAEHMWHELAVPYFGVQCALKWTSRYAENLLLVNIWTLACALPVVWLPTCPEANFLILHGMSSACPKLKVRISALESLSSCENFLFPLIITDFVERESCSNPSGRERLELQAAIWHHPLLDFWAIALQEETTIPVII